jgi:hypothetical protein
VAEMMQQRHFAEEAGFMGSETAAPNLFGGQTESEQAARMMLGDGLGRFGLVFGESAHSNDPLAYEDPFSCHQNQGNGDFLCQEIENVPIMGVLGYLGGDSGISEVD